MDTNRRTSGLRRIAAVLTALGSLAVVGPLGPGATAAHADPVGGPGCTAAGAEVTCAFDWTGGSQLWSVPPGVTAATVTAYGAAGGGGSGQGYDWHPGPGGPGGRQAAALSGLTPGQRLQVNVGGVGGDLRPGGPFWYPAAGGFNGGGTGFTGGGGASDVRAADGAGQYGPADRLVVAGGGGGAGAGGPLALAAGGGAGGGAVGGSSLDSGQTASGGTQGAGGSNTGGGAGSNPWHGTEQVCHDGRFGEGGTCLYTNQLLSANMTHGGGGGGGWYGGGVGLGPGSGFAQTAGPGGGGSSHAGPADGVAVADLGTASGGTFTPPAGTGGNGRVQISYTLANFSATGFRGAAGSWTLASGQTLSTGTDANSPNTAFVLTMQGDGNLILTSPGVPGVRWASSTWGNPGATARFTADGVLQVVGTTGAVLWRSAVAGGLGATFVFLPGGTLQILDRYSVQCWFTSLTGEFGGLTLFPNNAVSVGGSNHQLVMQGDGNLVWYGAGLQPIWASNTWGNDGRGFRFDFAPRGTLAIHDGTGTLVWSAGPASGGWWLRLQGDGNIVIVDAARVARWATGTSG
ncbi:glycine-rich protein [Kitasatospora sp. NPDC002040]|uniref:glycine-rich protein n=1 Tax=Kitasatospora sp. NPDC002040 TaxID=3154661 RepID=UPI003320C601